MRTEKNIPHINFLVVDRIIRHLKLSFQPERPPPPQIAQPELLMAAEEKDESSECVPGCSFIYLRAGVYLVACCFAV